MSERDTPLTNALVDSYPENLLQAVIDHARALERHCEAMADAAPGHARVLVKEAYLKWKAEQLGKAEL